MSNATPPEYVMTPLGPRLKAHVHKVAHGHALRRERDSIHQLDNRENILATFAVQPQPVAPVVPASGWITDAFWTNGTGQPVTLFKCTWTVPSAPASEASPRQLIYLFNGMENATDILQPVLQWGTSAAADAPAWSIASWYVGRGASETFYSDSAAVQPGQVLTGVIRLLRQGPAGCSYRCEFEGIQAAALGVQNIPELTLCEVALEAYGITQATDYPAAALTRFSGVNVAAGAAQPPVVWTEEPTPPATQPLGEHCVIPINSGMNGQIDLYYRP